MKRLRFGLAVVLLVAGATGLVAAMIAVLGVHQAGPNLAAQSAEVLGATADAVQFLKRGATRIDTLLGETRVHVQALDATLASVADKIKSDPTGKTLLDALDQNIAWQLQRAQATVTSLHATLEGFHSTLVLFQSLPGTGKKQPGEEADLSQVLIEASAILDQLGQFLNDILTNREVSRTSLARLIGLVKQIQVRLADAAKQVGDFQQRLGAAEARIAASRTDLPEWIEQGSSLAIVLLVCFAFTQVGLMLQAARLMRGNAVGCYRN